MEGEETWRCGYGLMEDWDKADSDGENEEERNQDSSVDCTKLYTDMNVYSKRKEGSVAPVNGHMKQSRWHKAEVTTPSHLAKARELHTRSRCAHERMLTHTLSRREYSRESCPVKRQGIEL